MQTTKFSTAKQAIANNGTKPGAASPVSNFFRFTAGEGERLLRIMSRTSQINCHYELFQLLQDEVQYFLPHQILISAWGDFRGANLEIDVISAIPGVRTRCLDECDIDDSLRGLHARWLAQGRQPLLIDDAGMATLSASGCKCALHHSLKTMPSILIHGVHDARNGADSLYLAAHSVRTVNWAAIERLRDRIDPILSQIDVAFRRVASLQSRAKAGPGTEVDLTLSKREEEILTWVSAGRTNIEISRILSISTFTVKNHVQRIIKKLDAANRAEAVAKYRDWMQGARRRASMPRVHLPASGEVAAIAAD